MHLPILPLPPMLPLTTIQSVILPPPTVKPPAPSLWLLPPVPSMRVPNLAQYLRVNLSSALSPRMPFQHHITGYYPLSHPSKYQQGYKLRYHPDYLPIKNILHFQNICLHVLSNTNLSVPPKSRHNMLWIKKWREYRILQLTPTRPTRNTRIGCIIKEN